MIWIGALLLAALGLWLLRREYLLRTQLALLLDTQGLAEAARLLNDYERMVLMPWRYPARDIKRRIEACYE